jgi:nucleoside-diphosphate-sugar epimerase
VTVRGTARPLDNLEVFDVEQFVFSSTVLVHAPTEPGETIGEDDPLEATWPYPESKIETEGVIRRDRARIPVVIVRLAGVYDEDGHSPPIANQIRRIHGRALTGVLCPADQERGQAFVRIDDAVDALVRIVDGRHELGPGLELLIGEPETPKPGTGPTTCAHRDGSWHDRHHPALGLAKQRWRDRAG